MYVHSEYPCDSPISIGHPYTLVLACLWITWVKNFFRVFCSLYDLNIHFQILNWRENAQRVGWQNKKKTRFYLDDLENRWKAHGDEHVNSNENHKPEARTCWSDDRGGGVYFFSSPIGTTARPDSFVNKQNLQWAMNEVWTLREQRSPPSTPAAAAAAAAAGMQDPIAAAAAAGTTDAAPTAAAAPCSPTSYPFELPERRSTLRALIDEFRRAENADNPLDGGQWPGSSGPLPAASWTSARRQLLKAPPQKPRDRAAATMKKSASVWYDVPPAPDRPPLVSRMSMPDLNAERYRHRTNDQRPPSAPAVRSNGAIPEELWPDSNARRPCRPSVPRSYSGRTPESPLATSPATNYACILFA